MLRRLLCFIGLHFPSDLETAVVFASVYRREECHSCGDISYYVMGLGGMDKLSFVPSPWSHE